MGARVIVQVHKVFFTREKQGCGIAHTLGHRLIINPNFAHVVCQIITHGPL